MIGCSVLPCCINSLRPILLDPCGRTRGIQISGSTCALFFDTGSDFSWVDSESYQLRDRLSTVPAQQIEYGTVTVRFSKVFSGAVSSTSGNTWQFSRIGLVDEYLRVDEYHGTTSRACGVIGASIHSEFYGLNPIFSLYSLRHLGREDGAVMELVAGGIDKKVCDLSTMNIPLHMIRYKSRWMARVNIRMGDELYENRLVLFDTASTVVAIPRDDLHRFLDQVGLGLLMAEEHMRYIRMEDVRGRDLPRMEIIWGPKGFQSCVGIAVDQMTVSAGADEFGIGIGLFPRNKTDLGGQRSSPEPEAEEDYWILGMSFLSHFHSEWKMDDNGESFISLYNPVVE